MYAARGRGIRNSAPLDPRSSSSVHDHDNRRRIQPQQESATFQSLGPRSICGPTIGFGSYHLQMSAIVSNQNQEPKTRCPTCGCVGKNPTYEKLTKEEIDAEMKTLATGVWQVSEDYVKISRTFKCRNWQGAVDFINQASVIAESEGVDHHPDIHLTMYRVVEVVCWTHATGGLTKSG
jgi:pterin-4a-carbinolamine dehydratase